MPEENSSSAASSPIVGDLAGVGKLIDSEVAKRTYDDALSPVMKEVGSLSVDTVRALRLFTAPLQLAAAYQARFEAFCERVRAKVPEDQQREAPPEIAMPVMKAFASTSDGGPLMGMFEELMAKAIDKREADKLSPAFPAIIASLSPLQALLISDLVHHEHVIDETFDSEMVQIVELVKANFDLDTFGGSGHHLTIVQDLEDRNIVTTIELKVDAAKEYPSLKMPRGTTLHRRIVRLTMLGRWFAAACVPQ